MDDSVGFFNLDGENRSAWCQLLVGVMESTRRAVTLTVLRRNLVNNAHVRHLRI